MLRLAPRAASPEHPGAACQQTLDRAECAGATPATPEAAHAIALLAALSHGADFAVGCYCKDEDRCHRSVLRRLLATAGASIVD
jgi:hypothetical protein